MSQDTRSSSDGSSRWPVSRGQLTAVLVAALLVVSLPAMTLAGGLDSGTAEASSTTNSLTPTAATTTSPSPTGEYVYTASANGSVQQINPNTANVVSTFDTAAGPIDEVIETDDYVYVLAKNAVYKTEQTESGLSEVSNYTEIGRTDTADYYNSMALSPDNETLWVTSQADSVLRAIQTSDMSESDNLSISLNSPKSMSYLNGSLYIVDGNGMSLHRFDTTPLSDPGVSANPDITYWVGDVGVGNSSIFWGNENGFYEYDDNLNVVASNTDKNSRGQVKVFNNTIYAGDTDGDLHRFDKSTLTADTLTLDQGGSRVYGVFADSPTSTVYAGTQNGSLYTVSPDLSSASEYNLSQDAITHIDGGKTSLSKITGTVTDQSDNPISNATLISHSITEPALDKSDARSLQRQAEDLRNELTNPLPSEWEDFESDFETDNGLLDKESFRSGIDGTYPLVHQGNDWGSASGWEATQISSNIDDPRVQLDPDQPVIISLWDPAKERPVQPRGPVRNSFLGEPTADAITIEQYGPTEVVDTTTYESETVAVENKALGGQIEHPGVKTDLPPGVYRAYPEGQPAKAYTFVVGSPSDLESAWESQLRNEADQLTDRAKRIQDLLSQDHVTRSTTTTDANGSFSIDVPSNAVTTDLKAIKADGELLRTLENPQNASLEDLRQFQTQGYNGTFYLPSPTPNTVEPPAENVSVTVYRSPEVPLGNMESFADLMSFLDKQRLNETVDELRSEYDQQLSELERSSAERIYTDHRTLTETVPGAEGRYLERSDFDEIQSAEDLSQSELTTETRHMQTALAGVGELEPPDPGDIQPPEVGDGGIDFTYPLPDSVDPDSVAPEIHWSDGTVEPIAEDYYSVQSAGPLAGQELVISELPISDSDPAAFDIRVRGASDSGSLLPGGANGGLLDDRVSGMNPAAAGVAPPIDGVDFSTLSPGPSESVSVGINPADESGYDRLVAASAWDDDGTEINATVDPERDRASFMTNGEGTHTVRLTYQNQQGDRFTVAERIDAKPQPRSDPATIRASGSAQSMTGVYAVTGENLAGARLEQTAGTLSVTVIAEDSDGPGELNIKPSNVMQGTTHTYDIEVVHGSSQTSVQSNIPVNIHLTSPRDMALYWRSSPGFGGAPITHEGGTRYGSVSKPSEGKHIIHTYTQPDGSVTISAVEAAGPLDRASHQVSQYIGNVPFVGWLAIPSGAGLALVVPAGIVYRRRRAA